MVGESEDMRLMAPIEAVQVADANRDVIVGIKVRVGRGSSGIHGVAPLDIALQAANEVGMPLMCHIDFPPPSYEEVVETPAPRRRAHPCVPPVPERADRSPGQGEAGRDATRARAA